MKTRNCFKSRKLHLTTLTTEKAMVNAKKIKASFNYVFHSQLLINILLCKEKLQSK